MIDRCLRTESTHCDPSHLTLNLQSWVIQLSYNSWSPSSHTYQSDDLLLVPIRVSFAE